MIRRFNYTNRRKINQEDVKVSLVRDHDGVFTFNIDLHLNAYDFLPKDAYVKVDAYHQSARMQFAYGTVANIIERTLTQNRLIHLIDNDNILFHLKIVDKHSIGRLIAEASQIAPDRPDELDQPKKSLLRMHRKELGERAWAMEIDTNGPILFFHSKFIEGMELIRTDRFFQSVVLPSVLESLFSQLLFVEEIEMEGNANSWERKWIRFAESLAASDCPSAKADPEVKRDWISEVVYAFCRKHKLFSNMMKERETR